MSEVIEGEEGDGPVVSERVQVLAQGIYDELQGLMDEYGQESIANLMPLVVNVLENLDSALSDNQDHLTALMEVNEENETLMKQYDREKQRRKEIEEKAMRVEDVNEGEVRELKMQVAKVESENRGLGAKMANQKEQIERLEERCEEMMKEKKELHDKNIELIKNFHEKYESFIKENALKMASKARTLSTEEGEDSKRPLGFQDFMAPTKSGRKKRTLPIAPQRRNREEGEEDDEELVGETPQRPDSPEFHRGEGAKTPPNLRSLHEEQTEEEDENHGEGLHETFLPNEESLLAELHIATTGSTATGVDQIITENEELMTAKQQLTKEVDELTTKLMTAENEKKAAETELTTVQNDRDTLSARTAALEGEVKRMRRELEEEREKITQMKDAEEKGTGDGLRLTKLEVARVLRERNEYKEKYLSLLEQVRMNDEMYLFKKSKKSSRWVDYFAALFSPAKRRQLEKVLDGTPRKPILGAGKTSDIDEEQDGGEPPQAGHAGYCMTHTIPILRRNKRQEELLMTSVSWLTPPSNAHHSNQTELQTVSTPPLCPGINTCRPMSYQEDGTKVLCAAPVNPVTFLSDHDRAITVNKRVTPPPEGVATEKGRPPVHVPSDGEESMSIVWIITGVPNLTKVSVLDAAAMGEVLESFIVSSTPVQCISAIPAFDENDPDVLTSLSSSRRKRSNAVTDDESTPPPPSLQDRPPSREATMWMGSDQGVLYVHSAVTKWRRCIHADKLPAAIQSIIHIKGKVFVLLANASVAVFRRFPDGEWDWDNYSVVYLSQKKDLPVTAMASVKFNVWCAIGNSIHVIHSHLLKMEATFAVHSRKRAVVGDLVVVGDGVWISFLQDSTLRLYNGTTFTHMQDLDIAPAVRKNIVFGGEKRSHAMPIQISSVVAAHNSLWVGTENGLLLTFPFNAPTVVAEEAGWEVIKEAEVGGAKVPEPFDVRTEKAEEAGSLSVEPATKPSHKKSPVHKKSPIHMKSPIHKPETSHDSSGSQEGSAQLSDEAPLPPPHINMSAPPRAKPFTPFCNVDQSQISIHCHINAIRTLLCVPGLVPQDVAVFEPLGGVLIGTGDTTDLKPALFVVSCGEGHLDLRTADKVLETLQAKESGQSGLPDAASIISEKNYIMVWDVAA